MSEYIELSRQGVWVPTNLVLKRLGVNACDYLGLLR